MRTGLALWLALIAVVLVSIAAMKSNGATKHPLLVDAKVQAPMLFSPCPLTPKNLPRPIERNA